MATESVANPSVSLPYALPHREDFIAQTWQESGLPVNVAHRLADVHNAALGMSGILRVLRTDENDAEEAESWSPEENFVHMPLNKQTRWELHKALELLMHLTHSRMEDLPGIVKRELPPKGEYVDVPVLQPRAVV